MRGGNVIKGIDGMKMDIIMWILKNNYMEVYVEYMIMQGTLGFASCWQ